MPIIDINRFSFSAKVFPSPRSPTIDIRTAILWTCNGSDHRPSKVASFWRVESNNGNVEEACMYLYIYMYCILYNAHSIKLYRTLKRLRFPLSTIESSGCSWLPTIPMASPQKGPRVVMSGWHLETAMFFLCLSWIIPKTCDVKDF